MDCMKGNNDAGIQWGLITEHKMFNFLKNVLSHPSQITIFLQLGVLCIDLNAYEKLV